MENFGSMNLGWDGVSVYSKKLMTDARDFPATEIHCCKRYGNSYKFSISR
jgi:hypothetical protein